jgi:dTDP-4-dehydrorhamnose reductase
MARIAVTGSTGFVGSNISEALALSGHEVIGFARDAGRIATPWKLHSVDYSSLPGINAAMDGVDAIVHCAIANDFNRLLNDRAAGYEAYVSLTDRIATVATERGAHLIFISTDWVMDGEGHREPESNPGNAINFYGYLKALGEQAVRSRTDGRGTIARIAGVMGRHRLTESPRQQDVGFGYFVDTLVQTLQRGEKFAVWGGPHVNKVTSPSLASEVGAQIGRIVDRGTTGTLHLVGDDAVGRMELAHAACDVFELPHELLVETEPPESELFPAPVPRDSSLGNEATKKLLGIAPQSITGILGAFRTEIESGRVQPLTRA